MATRGRLYSRLDAGWLVDSNLTGTFGSALDALSITPWTRMDTDVSRDWAGCRVVTGWVSVGRVSGMISEEKRAMRAVMREWLGGMTLDARASASRSIAREVRAELERVGARCVLGFAPLASEPDWWGGAVPGMRFGFPRVMGDGLRFFEAGGLGELVPGGLGVREPGMEAREVVPGDADVVLVPGVAFDRAGGRLGRGGGFYDRLLAELPPGVLRLGVAFGRQVVAGVPMDGHDFCVDRVVTECGALACNSERRDAAPRTPGGVRSPG